MEQANNKIKSYNVNILKLFQIILHLNEVDQARLLRFANDLNAGDKREYVRQECHIPISYLVKNRFYSDFMENISENGAYIETDDVFMAGLKILILFPRQLIEGSLKVEGQIIWCDQKGIGVIFSNLDDDQKHLLNLIIDQLKPECGSKNPVIS